METTIYKDKVVEKKFGRSLLQRFYMRYLRRKDTDCRFCGDNSSLGHKCSNQNPRKYEDERPLDTSISNSYEEEESRNKTKCHKCGKNWFSGHRSTSKQLYHCKILNGKEVEVPAKEGMSNSDEEESPNVSLESITCIRQGCKENYKVPIQEKEMQPFTTHYISPHLRNSSTICNSQDIKPIISFETIIEQMKPNTLKLKGILKEKDIAILIDSRSTHNFMDINLTRKLNLFMYPIKGLTVTTANGQPIEGIRQCCKISIHIQNLKLQTRYYTLPICGIDMVLGEKWLVPLGTYATNLQEQFMEFKWKGKSYKLYGPGSQNIP
jgi:hypothetical protein